MSLKTKTPVSLLQDSIDLVDFIRKSIKDYADFLCIKKINDEDFLIEVAEKDPDPSFLFRVKHADFENISGTQKGIFNVLQNPSHNTRILGAFSHKHDSKKIKDAFSLWLRSVILFNDNSIVNNPITKAYEEEFYSEHRILDEDADEKPFGRQQQQQLHLFLGCMGKALEKESTKDETITPIILEIKEVQKNMTSMSKNGLILKISKVFAKIHVHGIDLSNKYWGKFQEEGFKMIVQQTIEDLKEMATPPIDAIRALFTSNNII